MKVRSNAHLLSTVLFTVSLLSLVPWCLNVAKAGRDRQILASWNDVWMREYARASGDLGLSSLIIIVLGLLIIWMGYLKKDHWTWFAMLIISWAWVFPVFLLPLLRPKWGLTFTEFAYEAVLSNGLARVMAESLLIFLMMQIALILPIHSFLNRKSTASASA